MFHENTEIFDLDEIHRKIILDYQFNFNNQRSNQQTNKTIKIENNGILKFRKNMNGTVRQIFTVRGKKRHINLSIDFWTADKNQRHGVPLPRSYVRNNYK